MFLRILLLVFISKCCSAVIYSLNGSDYNRMPPLFQMDEYQPCALESGTYCVATLDLVSDGTDLMRLIEGYSAAKLKHYNHTKIHRGVCITKTCKNFTKYATGTEVDQSRTLEACLNDSVYRDYKLQGKMANFKYCIKDDDKMNIENIDIIMAVVYLILITLNVVGSIYDVTKFDKDDNSGNPYLLAFSVRRNWNRLVAPIVVGKEPRLERLRLFHGIRTLTMVCVVFSHTVLMIVLGFVSNPLYIEKSYEDPLKQILFNGSLVTHTFFVMSSFLMAYNLQLHAEKHGTTWLQWPKGVLMRWLRLTPTYALVLATICSWFRHLGSGPLWPLLVTEQTTACRHYWWAHLFYFNNYVYDDSQCSPETWYLAADTQLFCVGLLLCVLTRTPRSRVVALVVMFLVSLVTAAGHTYFQDLDAVVMQSPESYRSLYANDDTFRIVYIRGHTNLSTYTLGLAGGFFTYYWQTEKKDLNKLRNYRWLFWLIVPLGVAVILSGGLFYIDGEQPSILLKVLYATFYKPVFQMLVVAFIIGCVFKFETVYRGVVEWRGLTWTGRVSYSAYLVHTLFLRALVGSYPRAIELTDYLVMTLLCGILFLTYISAAVLWMTVESPLAGVIKAVMEGKPKVKDDETHVDRSKV